MVTLWDQPRTESPISQQQRHAVIAANIRALRQRKRWAQARLGQLTGCPSASAVCAAEGRRGDRQRGFTTGEIQRLAAIVEGPPSQLAAQRVTCGSHPPAGYACLACGTAAGNSQPVRG